MTPGCKVESNSRQCAPATRRAAPRRRSRSGSPRSRQGGPPPDQLLARSSAGGRPHMTRGVCIQGRRRRESRSTWIPAGRAGRAAARAVRPPSHWHRAGGVQDESLESSRGVPSHESGLPKYAIRSPDIQRIPSATSQRCLSRPASRSAERRHHAPQQCGEWAC